MILSEFIPLFILRDIRNGRKTFGQIFIGRNGVRHRAVVVLFVCGHIEITGTGQTEENGLFLARLLAFERFVDGGADGMAGFGGGQDALGAGKLFGRLDGLCVLRAGPFRLYGQSFQRTEAVSQGSHAYLRRESYSFPFGHDGGRAQNFERIPRNGRFARLCHQ